MNNFYINFNGMDIPDFVRVKAVNTTALPEISNNYKNVAGGFGVISTGTAVGGKTIEIEFVIVLPKGLNLLQAERELAYWLMGNDFKLSPLVISDECELEYQAQVNGNVNVSDLLVAGEGTIEFFVPRGVATHRFTKHGAVDNTNKEVVVDYYGTADSFPVFEFTPSREYVKESFRLTHKEKGESLILTGNFKAGEKITIDCNKKLVKIGNDLQLNMLDLQSRWLKISSRRINTFTFNFDGEMVMDYKENWL